MIFLEVDTRLVAYVKENLRKGFSENIIKAHLLKNGYPIGTVNETVVKAMESSNRKSLTQLDKLNRQSMGIFHYMKVFLLILLCIASFSALILMFDIRSPMPLVLVSMLVVIFGMFSAMTLQKSATSSTAFELGVYIVAAVTSRLLSSVFVFANRMIIQYGQSGEMTSKIGYAINPLPNPFIAGIVFVTLFSLPSIAYYFRWERRNYLVFGSYLFWLIVYIIVHKIVLAQMI